MESVTLRVCPDCHRPECIESEICPCRDHGRKVETVTAVIQKPGDRLIGLTEDDRERLGEIATLIEARSTRDDATRDARYLRNLASLETDTGEGK